MTDTLLTAMVVSPLLAAVVLLLAGRGSRRAQVLNGASATITAGIGIAAGVSLALGNGSAPTSAWVVADVTAGCFVLVVTIVAAASALLSPAYLRSVERTTFFGTGRGRRAWYVALYGFWASLVALPIVGNLGIVWLVIEASTAASAVLVAYSGRPRALEAGWKYLMLTTLGLSLAFLGIVATFVASGDARGGLHLLDWTRLEATFGAMPHEAAVAAYALVILGLATKIGWAPVHHWLPDAHSEAPAPVSAMLSAAQLPVVVLVAWRLRDAAVGAIGETAANAPIIAFSLASVAIAVPFLWQPLAWKRLLAYSSLEHMGIIGLGIAFAHPLATAGVILHVAGHALAKSLGFHAALALHEVQPRAARQPARGVGSSSPATLTAMTISTVTLSGLPPGPLFLSELLIVLGGIAAGHVVLAILLATLLALAFIGLLRTQLLAVQDAAREGEHPVRRSMPIVGPTILASVGLLALLVAPALLHDSSLVHALGRLGG
jgi:hydrogenase-4 component F